MPVAGNYFIQTSVDKQVNLVNADGLTLNYWDGDAGPKNNGVIDGGSGTWRVGGAGTSDNWTNTAGTVNAAWSQGAFAVFAGQGGNVKVDSATAIQVQGMQFAANGYTLVNNAGTDALTLTGAVVSGGGPNEADVRVGDGSAAAPATRPTSPPRWRARPGWSRRTWAPWCCPASIPMPAAPLSKAARCR